MPDDMDRVQELTGALDAAALERHAARPRPPGRSHCSADGCGEVIAENRQQLGARLCMAHQREHEAREAHLARWRQR